MIYGWAKAVRRERRVVTHEMTDFREGDENRDSGEENGNVCQRAKEGAALIANLKGFKAARESTRTLGG